MNRRKLANLPIAIYSLLPPLLWLYSLIDGLLSLLLGDGEMLVLSSSLGIRWFVASSVEAISSVPWGKIILILAMIGLVDRCEVLHVARKLVGGGSLSMRMRRALLSAFAAALLCLFALVVATIYPLNISNSITGVLFDSPLFKGWLFLLFGALFFVTVVFGIVYGSFRNVDDVVEAMCSRLRFHTASLLALLPAALFMATVGHMGMAVFDIFLVKWLFLLLPFIYDEIYAKKNKST